MAANFIQTHEQLVIFECHAWLLHQDEKRLRQRLNDAADLKQAVKDRIMGAYQHLKKREKDAEEILQLIEVREAALREELDGLANDIFECQKLVGPTATSAGLNPLAPTVYTRRTSIQAQSQAALMATPEERAAAMRRLEDLNTQQAQLWSRLERLILARNAATTLRYRIEELVAEIDRIVTNGESIGKRFLTSLRQRAEDGEAEAEEERRITIVMALRRQQEREQERINRLRRKRKRQRQLLHALLQAEAAAVAAANVSDDANGEAKETSVEIPAPSVSSLGGEVSTEDTSDEDDGVDTELLNAHFDDSDEDSEGELGQNSKQPVPESSNDKAELTPEARLAMEEDKIFWLLSTPTYKHLAYPTCDNCLETFLYFLLLRLRAIRKEQHRAQRELTDLIVRRELVMHEINRLLKIVRPWVLTSLQSSQGRSTVTSRKNSDKDGGASTAVANSQLSPTPASPDCSEDAANPDSHAAFVPQLSATRCVRAAHVRAYSQQNVLSLHGRGAKISVSSVVTSPAEEGNAAEQSGDSKTSHNSEQGGQVASAPSESSPALPVISSGNPLEVSQQQADRDIFGSDIPDSSILAAVAVANASFTRKSASPSDHGSDLSRPGSVTDSTPRPSTTAISSSSLQDQAELFTRARRVLYKIVQTIHQTGHVFEHPLVRPVPRSQDASENPEDGTIKGRKLPDLGAVSSVRCVDVLTWLMAAYVVPVFEDALTFCGLLVKLGLADVMLPGPSIRAASSLIRSKLQQEIASFHRQLASTTSAQGIVIPEWSLLLYASGVLPLSSVEAALTSTLRFRGPGSHPRLYELASPNEVDMLCRERVPALLVGNSTERESIGGLFGFAGPIAPGSGTALWCAPYVESPYGTADTHAHMIASLRPGVVPSLLGTSLACQIRARGWLERITPDSRKARKYFVWDSTSCTLEEYEEDVFAASTRSTFPALSTSTPPTRTYWLGSALITEEDFLFNPDANVFVPTANAGLLSSSTESLQHVFAIRIRFPEPHRSEKVLVLLASSRTLRASWVRAMWLSGCNCERPTWTGLVQAEADLQESIMHWARCKTLERSTTLNDDDDDDEDSGTCGSSGLSLDNPLNTSVVPGSPMPTDQSIFPPTSMTEGQRSKNPFTKPPRAASGVVIATLTGAGYMSMKMLTPPIILVRSPPLVRCVSSQGSNCSAPEKTPQCSDSEDVTNALPEINSIFVPPAPKPSVVSATPPTFAAIAVRDPSTPLHPSLSPRTLVRSTSLSTVSALKAVATALSDEAAAVAANAARESMSFGMSPHLSGKLAPRSSQGELPTLILTSPDKSRSAVGDATPQPPLFALPPSAQAEALAEREPKASSICNESASQTKSAVPEIVFELNPTPAAPLVAKPLSLDAEMRLLQSMRVLHAYLRLALAAPLAAFSSPPRKSGHQRPVNQDPDVRNMGTLESPTLAHGVEVADVYEDPLLLKALRRYGLGTPIHLESRVNAASGDGAPVSLGSPALSQTGPMSLSAVITPWDIKCEAPLLSFGLAEGAFTPVWTREQAVILECFPVVTDPPVFLAALSRRRFARALQKDGNGSEEMNPPSNINDPRFTSSLERKLIMAPRSYRLRALAAAIGKCTDSEASKPFLPMLVQAPLLPCAIMCSAEYPSLDSFMARFSAAYANAVNEATLVMDAEETCEVSPALELYKDIMVHLSMNPLDFSPVTSEEHAETDSFDFDEDGTGAMQQEAEAHADEKRASSSAGILSESRDTAPAWDLLASVTAALSMTSEEAAPPSSTSLSPNSCVHAKDHQRQQMSAFKRATKAGPPHHPPQESIPLLCTLSRFVCATLLGPLAETSPLDEAARTASGEDAPGQAFSTLFASFVNTFNSTFALAPHVIELSQVQHSSPTPLGPQEQNVDPNDRRMSMASRASLSTSCASQSQEPDATEEQVSGDARASPILLDSLIALLRVQASISPIPTTTAISIPSEALLRKLLTIRKGQELQQCPTSATEVDQTSVTSAAFTCDVDQLQSAPDMPDTQIQLSRAPSLTIDDVCDNFSGTLTPFKEPFAGDASQPPYFAPLFFAAAQTLSPEVVQALTPTHVTPSVTPAAASGIQVPTTMNSCVDDIKLACRKAIFSSNASTNEARAGFRSSERATQFLLSLCPNLIPMLPPIAVPYPAMNYIRTVIQMAKDEIQGFIQHLVNLLMSKCEVDLVSVSAEEVSSAQSYTELAKDRVVRYPSLPGLRGASIAETMGPLHAPSVTSPSVTLLSTSRLPYARHVRWVIERTVSRLVFYFCGPVLQRLYRILHGYRDALLHHRIHAFAHKTLSELGATKALCLDEQAPYCSFSVDNVKNSPLKYEGYLSLEDMARKLLPQTLGTGPPLANLASTILSRSLPFARERAELDALGFPWVSPYAYAVDCFAQIFVMSDPHDKLRFVGSWARLLCACIDSGELAADYFTDRRNEIKSEIKQSAARSVLAAAAAEAALSRATRKIKQAHLAAIRAAAAVAKARAQAADQSNANCHLNDASAPSSTATENTVQGPFTTPRKKVESMPSREANGRDGQLSTAGSGTGDHSVPSTTPARRWMKKRRPIVVGADDLIVLFTLLIVRMTIPRGLTDGVLGEATPSVKANEDGDALNVVAPTHTLRKKPGRLSSNVPDEATSDGVSIELFGAAHSVWADLQYIDEFMGMKDRFLMTGYYHATAQASVELLLTQDPNKSQGAD